MNYAVALYLLIATSTGLSLVGIVDPVIVKAIYLVAYLGFTVHAWRRRPRRPD